MTPRQLLLGYVAMLVSMVVFNGIVWLVIGALR